MSTGPTTSLYASTPAAARARIQPGWTVHRDVIAAAEVAALAAGAPSTAAWVEEQLARAAGIEPPAPPVRGRRKK